MQDSVYREKGQFLFQRDVVCLGLPRGGIYRDYYVAKQGRHSRNRGWRRKFCLLIALRERENIGRLVVAAITQIQVMYTGVIRQENANFGVFPALGAEQAAGCLPQFRCRHRARISVLKIDGHTISQVPSKVSAVPTR